MKKLSTITLSLFILSALSFAPFAHALVGVQAVSAKTSVALHGDADEDNDAVEDSVKASADIRAHADIAFERDDDSRNATGTPPGIGRAPGIEKRLKDGKGLPKGILMKLFGKEAGKAMSAQNRKGNGKDKHATTTLDTTAPIIFSVSVNAATSTATIRFFTNERTAAEVRYGVTGATSTTIVDTTVGLEHRVKLSGLTPDTSYTYGIVASDANGNTKESGSFSFRTDSLTAAPHPDITAPHIIVAFALQITADNAKILWVTTEPADGKVYLGTTSPVIATGTPVVAETGLTFFHEATLSGLASSTTYFYTIASADSAGNIGLRENGTFKTSAR